MGSVPIDEAARAAEARPRFPLLPLLPLLPRMRVVFGLERRQEQLPSGSVVVESYQCLTLGLGGRGL